MSVRKRTWNTSDGERKEAWIVDYADQDGDRHLPPQPDAEGPHHLRITTTTAADDPQHKQHPKAEGECCCRIEQRTVTVAAGSCLMANTASTAALVLGDAAPGWLAEQRLPARLVRENGAPSLTGGWPSEAAAA